MDSNSSLYLDIAQPNLLLTFPPNAHNGMDKFVSSVGLLPQHAFGTCLAIFLIIVAVVVILSTVITLIGWTGSALLGGSKKPSTERKDLPEAEVRRAPWRRRFGLNSFHGSVAHGNLVRLLILFHLPITIFSCYHLQLGSDVATAKSKVLAGLSFTIFSLILPGWLIFRIVTTSTSKLYEATRTLLALGPLYNQYQPRSQLFCAGFFASNIIVGIVIGFGQQSGTVQAVIILVVEVLTTLSTSVWLPWMTGAQMGVISFMFCVARIVATVLVVILAPPVNIGSQAGGWIAFGILSILGLMYLGFAIMLVTKLLEGIVRAVRGLSFASSKHSLDSGLFGALGCCGGTTRKNKRRSHRRSGERRSGENRARHSRGYSESTANTVAPSYARPSNISYLKPEQASMPYRESSDDDAGFIMESWSKTDLNLPGGPRSKSKVTLESLGGEEQPTSTGFARVGGGRAHFDTPYAIMKGKQAAAPGRTAATPAPISQFGGQPPFETPPSISAPPEPLPKGAARPLHSRTRSHTAVIEDVSTLYPGAIPGATTATSKSTSRPGSSGNASRPGSSGRSATQHGRPSSAGKSRSYSRPASSHNGKSGPATDEMGVNHAAPKSASTSKNKGRGWFGLGGPSGGDSSSDEDDEEESKESSGKRSGAGGRWGFKRRRKSESDMSPVPTPTAENRSFVVIRNRPQQNPGYTAVPPVPTEGGGGHQAFNAFNVDPYGSPSNEPSGLNNVNMVLVSRTPITPEAGDQRPMSPPSSYVAPRGSSRRMSSPPS